MSYDEDEIIGGGLGGVPDEDAVLDDELLNEPLEGIEDFGLEDENPEHDR